MKVCVDVCLGGCGCACAFLFAANCGVKHEYTQNNCGGTANCGAPQFRSPHFYY